MRITVNPGWESVKLAAWRKRNGKSQEWLAAAIGMTQPYISQIERTRSPVIPSTEVMRKLYVLTVRMVQPNDFHPVEDWEADLVKAEGDAELAAIAA